MVPLYNVDKKGLAASPLPKFVLNLPSALVSLIKPGSLSRTLLELLLAFAFSKHLDIYPRSSGG
jgi:hypothetical protein